MSTHKFKKGERVRVWSSPNDLFGTVTRRYRSDHHLLYTIQDDHGGIYRGIPEVSLNTPDDIRASYDRGEPDHLRELRAVVGTFTVTFTADDPQAVDTQMEAFYKAVHDDILTRPEFLSVLGFYSSKQVRGEGVPHPKRRNGLCSVCGHYGDDCNGTPNQFQ